MRQMKINKLFWGLAAVLTLAFCSGNQKTNNSGSQELIGAGATFPYPLYSKMFDEYNKANGVRINYQSIGSGGGIKQLQNKTVDFGASDAPLSDEEMKSMPSPIIHIPTCLGALMITYNLSGNPELKLTPDVIADIFLGKITKWNAPRLTALNPSANLPNLAISVVHRSDGSGTTYVFSDYMQVMDVDHHSISEEDTTNSWSKLLVDTPVTLETLHQRKDGSTFPVVVRVSLIIHHQRKAVLGFARDISNRIAAEVALTESEQKYRLLAENTFDWVYWISPDGKLVFNSPSCEHITGYTLEEFEQNLHLIEKITHPDDSQLIRNHTKAVSGDFHGGGYYSDRQD